MSEEIMIDGVDVSGCIYKKDGIADCGMFPDGDYKCEGQICLYKQLKRLEQENEKLKEEIFNQEQMSKLQEKYKQALEEIKKISKIAFAVCDDDCGNANKFMDIINKVSEVLKDE